ncbi:hypothetical protein SCHPADRAFT_934243 [Schizopora paradoxa]|uniref:G-protein coupled receptors family 2 profile 2 domain-containing protein n=1 Tax=Schizopora paradoxa TaxID=27342 RepID=A0A0H2S803_9AGAM|nr:hypothetical protein SCHPADRAFT_934243 [Schizopora paradoxa]
MYTGTRRLSVGVLRVGPTRCPYVFYPPPLARFYSGGHLLDTQPPEPLCLIQAALNYSTAVPCTFRALMFVVNLWLSIRCIALEKAQWHETNKFWRWFSVVSPYAIFSVVFLVVLLVGSANLEKVFREYGSIFCSVDLPTVRGVQGLMAIFLFAVLVFEAWIAILLVQMHKQKIYLRRSGGPGPSYQLCVRVALFTGYILLAIAAMFCIWEKPIQGPFQTFSSIILSTVPFAVFLCFGTQTDLVRAYACAILWVWKRTVGGKDGINVVPSSSMTANRLDEAIPPASTDRDSESSR